MSLIPQPVIASFCEAYPKVELEIAASEELVDLVAGGFDAGIRLGQFLEADMVAGPTYTGLPVRRRRGAGVL